MMNMTSKDGFVRDFRADWRKESGKPEKRLSNHLNVR